MIGDIARALAQLRYPKFFGVVIWAMLITLAVLAGFVWMAALGLGLVLPDTVSVPFFGPVEIVTRVASWAFVGLLSVLSVFLMVPLSAVVVGFFLETVVDTVEAGSYPGLPKVEAMPIREALWEALRFFGLMVVVNLLALVVYLLANVAAPLVFWAVNGFLLGREYFQLVAARRLGRKGADALRKKHRLTIWATGAVMAVPLSVPLVNLFVPVLGVAAFTHQFHRLNRN